MVQVWTNGDDTKNVSELITFLEKQAKAKSAVEFKTFVITVTDKDAAPETAKTLSALADKLEAKEVHVTYLDKENRGVKSYKYNLAPEVKNTVFVYKSKKVTDKFVNFKADEKGLATLAEAIDKVTK